MASYGLLHAPHPSELLVPGPGPLCPEAPARTDHVGE
jgi:hypothetical protein